MTRLCAEDQIYSINMQTSSEVILSVPLISHLSFDSMTWLLIAGAAGRRQSTKSFALMREILHA